MVPALNALGGGSVGAATITRVFEPEIELPHFSLPAFLAEPWRAAMESVVMSSLSHCWAGLSSTSTLHHSSRLIATHTSKLSWCRSRFLLANCWLFECVMD